MPPAIKKDNRELPAGVQRLWGVRVSTFSLKGILMASLLVFAGCNHRLKAPHLKPADPLWHDVIVNHTGGLISRKDKIVVEFASDLFRKDQEGQPADGLLTVSPSVDGVAMITGAREITLLPRHDLEAGRYYVGRVKGRGIPGLSPKIPDFEFLFQVLPRDYSVGIDGLTASDTSKGQWLVKGTVATADIEDPAQVSRMLSVALAGQTLGVAWTHDASGKTHGFTISGIQRQAESETLKLNWNGRAMGAARSDAQSIEVPAKSVFKVVEAKALQGAEQVIVVYFSDTLNAHQNLRGLARLDGNVPSTARVEGSTLKIFPDDRLAGKATVIIDEGIQNAEGVPLGKTFSDVVTFSSQKPQVRFAGTGVILPDNPVLSIPFEAMNVRSVQVTAFQIYSNNVGRFLQANKLDGDQELERVGRFLWRKTIAVPAVNADQWQRFALDATELLQHDPGGIYRLTLSINRSNSTYACSQAENGVPAVPEDPLKNNEDLNVSQPSGWDGVEEEESVEKPADWGDHDDPCKDGYYQFAPEVKDTRNFLASDIGLLAKADQSGTLRVIVTHLRTAQPYAGVKINVFNFQNQPIAAGSSDGDGVALLAPAGVPFYLEADAGAQKGYLKLSDGAALPISHFDTGGDRVQAGLKGTIYGERGVWRPGDEIHLVFVLEDKHQAIPADHPATLRLFNPKGQLVDTRINSAPVDGFYRFGLRTAEDAPTGQWMAKVQLGGSEFTKSVRIEAVMPNRLKMDLDLGKDQIHRQDFPLKAHLSSQWLQGASAAGLKATVSVQYSAAPVAFTRYADHVFTDPARSFDSQPASIYTGTLDDNGRAAFPLSLETSQAAPAALNAEFYMQVFEEGGAFSGMHKSYPFYPYKRYIGIKLPKGDAARGILLTDTRHTVSVASLDSRGTPVSVKKVEMTLYKIDWKWWWDKSGDSLAQYANGTDTTPIQKEVISTHDGHGEWHFEVKYPEWGRFLIRACDLDGGHCTGQVFYVDWPGWAGRAKEQGGAAANALLFFADKPEYTVGETAVLRLPDATVGRALMTIESGSRVLQQRWLNITKEAVRVEVPITREMSPNVYVSITLLQPHEDKKNDLPIRLYGVIPLMVKDPATELTPVIEAADEWKPGSSVSVKVSEAKGREMTYTLAIVDEGLLGLTAFQTPDLHAFFYKKEALGVTTWDLFDDVVGAYGGELERLLALGGGEDRNEVKGNDEKRRFPPVVRFLGPFHLDGGSQTQTVELPPYVGAVRVMIVAGHRGAYGHAEKSVFVRQPLMLLSTLPRLVSPGEDMTVPVSVFSMDPSVKDVDVHLVTDKLFERTGPATLSVHFDKPGEKIVAFQIRSKDETGDGVVRVGATSGPNSADTETHLTIRRPNPPVTKSVLSAIAGRDSWTTALVPPGIPGTNSAVIEVSGVPPLSLERHLNYLITYPHGCVEQTTSAVFPQLYLPQLATLSEAQKKDVETNIKNGIQRLRTFQAANGGFMYWPEMGDKEPQVWATNYVGHFLIEAQQHGYAVPDDMRAQWLSFQRSRAQSWEPGGRESGLDQAYRLYTLALAGQAELGAMNRLREWSDLPNVARWQLAEAYQLAGVHDASDALAAKGTNEVPVSSDWNETFGSSLRDKAILVHAMTSRHELSRAKPLADELSKALSSSNWLSTQESAYALLAMAAFYGTDAANQNFSYRYTLGGQAPVTVHSSKPIQSVTVDQLPNEGETLRVENLTDRKLFVTVAVRGVPPVGKEEARAEGLGAIVSYEESHGQSINPSTLKQGAEIVAKVTVRNNTSETIDNIELTQMAPSGWEIQNPRWQEGSSTESGLDYQDVRDDRIYSYFKLEPEQDKSFSVHFTASYLGHFYLPGISAEPMYDATKGARTTGQWVTVKKEQ